MPFPLIPVIAGIASGVSAVVKKVKANKASKISTSAVSSGNTGIAGALPKSKKGFLGMFTGKNKEAKQQAEALANQFKAEEQKEEQKKKNSFFFGPGSIRLKKRWPIYLIVVGVGGFILYRVLGKKRRGRRR